MRLAYHFLGEGDAFEHEGAIDIPEVSELLLRILALLKELLDPAGHLVLAGVVPIVLLLIVKH